MIANIQQGMADWGVCKRGIVFGKNLGMGIALFKLHSAAGCPGQLPAGLLLKRES